MEVVENLKEMQIERICEGIEKIQFITKNFENEHQIFEFDKVPLPKKTRKASMI